METRTYNVALTVTTTHEYTVEARTPEEAEVIAERYFRDGEKGTLLEADIDYSLSDVTPVDIGAMGEATPEHGDDEAFGLAVAV